MALESKEEEKNVKPKRVVKKKASIDEITYCPTCGKKIKEEPPTIIQTRRGVAIIALVLGCVAIVFKWTIVVPILCGLAAIIVGIVGIRESDRTISIVGILLGTVAILFSIFMIYIGFPRFQQFLDRVDQELYEEEHYTDVLRLPGVWEVGDRGLIRFQQDGSYIWYDDEDVVDDNYTMGTYQLIQKSNPNHYYLHLTKKMVLNNNQDVTAQAEASVEYNVIVYDHSVGEMKLLVTDVKNGTSFHLTQTMSDVQDTNRI